MGVGMDCTVVVLPSVPELGVAGGRAIVEVATGGDMSRVNPQYEQQRLIPQRKLLERNGLKGRLLIAMEGVEVHVACDDSLPGLIDDSDDDSLPGLIDDSDSDDESDVTMRIVTSKSSSESESSINPGSESSSESSINPGSESSSESSINPGTDPPTRGAERKNGRLDPDGRRNPKQAKRGAKWPESPPSANHHIQRSPAI